MVLRKKLAGCLIAVALGFGCQKQPTAPQQPQPSVKAKLSYSIINLRQLTFGPARDITPSWSGDGRWIAFASRRSGNYDIWLTTPEADTLIQVTRNRYHEVSPSWAPDSLSLAYIAYPEGSRGNIRITNPFSRITTQITYSSNSIRETPAWSPRGGYLAFCSFLSGNWDIWVISREGAIQRNMTRNQATDLAPSWSPGGELLAFSSDRSGNPDIWLLSMSTKSLRRLTFYPGNDDYPAFSPDGRYLVFSSSRARNPYGRNDLWLYSFETHRFKRLTDGDGNDIQPHWSPDGRSIVFVSNRGGGYHIWVLELAVH